MVDIVIPVYNEAGSIDEAVRRLRDSLHDSVQDYGIRIVDNQSSDDTFKHAQSLEEEFDEVTAMRIPQQGKARAIRAGWEESEAEVLGFVDVDLSPSINMIPSMLSVVLETKGLAVSSRHLPSSHTVRPWSRSVVSYGYNFFLWVFTSSQVSDHQCGLKILHRDAWERMRDDTLSTEWFLDTEIILHAARLNIPVDEFAITWHEGADSGVAIIPVALKMMASLFRYWKRHGLRHQGNQVVKHSRQEQY